MVSLLGWMLFGRAFRDDGQTGARFATRFFLVMALLETFVYVGVVYAVYRLVAAGQG
jgi:F0F1-type ATP synthase membrane subunit c/vacuolar-type H+-ATPase subunit K